MNDRWTRKATSLCSNSTAVAHWTRIYDPDQPWADYEKVRDERLAERPQGLYYASLAGLFDVAVQLIERWNANVNAKGIGFYDNALRAASACGHERVVELLLGAGAEVNATGGGVFHNALQVASSRGHERVVELLLRAGANVNAKGDYFSGGFAALHYASDRGHKRVVELLLGAGADVDAKGHQFNGSSTALQYASTRGHEGVVKLLLDQGKIKQAMNAGDHQDSEGEQGPKEAQLMGLGKPQQTQEERETKVEHRLQISQAQH